MEPENEVTLYDLRVAMNTYAEKLDAITATLEALVAKLEPPSRVVRAVNRNVGAPSMIESFDEHHHKVLDLEKVATVRLVQKMYATGNYSAEALAQLMNASGEKSVRGARWHRTSILKAIRIKLPEEET